MKKLFLILLSLSCILTFSACGEEPTKQIQGGTVSTPENATTTPESVTQYDTPNESTENTQPEAIPQPIESEEASTKTIFEQFEDILTQNGITFEKNTPFAEMVGAEQGMKYSIEDGTIELYQFDTGSDVYKTAEENQELTLEGFGEPIVFPAKVRDGMALLLNNLDSEADPQKYEEFFELIK